MMIAAQATDAELNSTLLFIYSWTHKVIVSFRILEDLLSLKTTSWTQKLQEQLGKKPHVKRWDCGLLDGIQLNVPPSPFISPAAP
jgi:hypothetical protein